jgi:RNA polymerase sigma-70 factor (ECF subfamily)
MCAQVKGNRDDAEFVRRIVRRDARAFEALYDLYAPLVFGQLLQITGDRQAAEELLVETFYRAWSQAASFDEGRAALPRWLLGIARELAGRDAWRRYADLPVAAVA